MRAARLAGVPLTVVGDGPERAALSALAGDGVELVGRKSDEEVTPYRTSVATVLPGEEDFGIVPVRLRPAAGRWSRSAVAGPSIPCGPEPACSARGHARGAGRGFRAVLARSWDSGHPRPAGAL